MRHRAPTPPARLTASDRAALAELKRGMALFDAMLVDLLGLDRVLSMRRRQNMERSERAAQRAIAAGTGREGRAA
jgi:hypothetical protein